MLPRPSLPLIAAMLVAVFAPVYLSQLRAEDLPKDLSLDLGKGAKLDLVLIPAGKFEMGTPDTEPGHKKNETRHSVTISKPFYMGKTEVTQQQYDAIMAETPSKVKGLTLPVDRVTWEDASKFCEKLSELAGKPVQLPTEAQWEYACRAGTTTAYHSGDTLPPADANVSADPKTVGSDKPELREKTLPVGSFKPNAFGVYDMHGNVWEWCRDWYEENNAVATTPIQDPEGPAKSSEDPPVRVLRGGSFYSLPLEVRSGCRDSMAPGYRSARGGFRIIVTIESEKKAE
ncbi:MAG: formylglycine-generating enzyme family protein [Planctomycetota bacterium]